MSVKSFRVAGAAGAAVAVVLLAASCADDTGPGRVLYGSFGVAPVFSPAAGIVPVTAGRFVLRRTADAAIVLDSVIAIAPEADSVNLVLTVPLAQPGETFQLTIALVGTAGDTVFRAGPLTVTPITGTGTPPVIPVPLVYTGVGADAASVAILVPDTPLFFGQQLTLQAVVLDSAGQPIADVPVGWRSLDSTRVRVARPDSGRVIAQPLRGPARIVATLLTDQADTVQLLSQPLPNSIVLSSGNNQSGLPGVALELPLVAQVLAADAGGVAGVWVRFEVAAGGGTLGNGNAVDSALTGADGRAQAQLTLGPTGPQVVEASTSHLPNAVVTFNAALAVGVQVSWINGLGGAWSAGANWSTGVPPGPLDTAVITLAGTYTVTLDQSTAIGGLTLGGGAQGTQTLDATGIQTVTLGGDGSIGRSGRLGLVGGSLILLGGNVLTLNGGTVQVGPGNTLAVGAGDGTELTYAAGAIGGPGVLSLGPGTRFNVAIPLRLDSLVLVVNDATITDGGTGRLVIPLLSSMVLQSVTGSSVDVVVQNQGVLLATGTADVLTDSLYNEANASLQLGGGETGTTLSVNGLDNAGTISLIGAAGAPATLTVTGAGTLANRLSGRVVPIPGATHVVNATLVNEGTVLEGGSLAVNGSPTAQHRNTGTINVAAGQTLTITGGTFTNATIVGGPTGTIGGDGTLDVSGTTFINNGVVSPGFSPGVLGVAGPFAQGTTGTVSIELGGTIAGTGYDQLAVNGAATLQGTLNVGLLAGFAPAVGDQFTVLTYGSASGQFRTVNLPTLPLGLTWQTTTGAAGLMLAVLGPPPQIVFAGDSAGFSSGVFRVNTDGTGQFNVTSEGPVGDVYPRWSPDRTRITYTANAGGETNQLHVISPDGLQLAHLTSPFDTSARRARWSPNGVHLAFECGDGGYPNTNQDVCVIPDVTGPILSLEGIGDDAKNGKAWVTDSISTTLGGSGAFAWDPLKPDELVVVRDTVLDARSNARMSQFWRVGFDGTVVGPVTDTELAIPGGDTLRVVWMDWSPEGSFIAFAGLSQAGFQAIYRLDLADAKVTQLTFPQAAFNQDFMPVVSPDGSAIIFGRMIDIFLLMQVPSNAPGTELEMSPLFNFGPDQAGWDWSPDGTEIVLTEDVTGSSVTISKINRTTTQATFTGDVKAVGRRGLLSEVQDRQPSWRP